MKRLYLYSKTERSDDLLASISIKNSELVIESDDTRVETDLKNLVATLPRDSSGNLYIDGTENKFFVNHPNFFRTLGSRHLFTFNSNTGEYPKFGGYEFDLNLYKIVKVIRDGGIEKLRLFGEKDEERDFIASVYVEDGKVKVGSKNHQIAELLSKMINKELRRSGGFRLPWSETELDFGHLTHSDGFRWQRPGDSHFLEALDAEFFEHMGLGMKGKLRNTMVCGYRINSNLSELIEE